MKYKILVVNVEKITSQVIVHYDGQTKGFANGLELTEFEFEKNYLIDCIYDTDGKIHIELKLNDKVNTTCWVGEEQVGFL